MSIRVRPAAAADVAAVLSVTPAPHPPGEAPQRVVLMLSTGPILLTIPAASYLRGRLDELLRGVRFVGLR